MNTTSGAQLSNYTHQHTHNELTILMYALMKMRVHIYIYIYIVCVCVYDTRTASISRMLLGGIWSPYLPTERVSARVCTFAMRAVYVCAYVPLHISHQFQEDPLETGGKALIYVQLLVSQKERLRTAREAIF